jgi:hypothetical protein
MTLEPKKKHPRFYEDPEVEKGSAGKKQWKLFYP